MTYRPFSLGRYGGGWLRSWRQRYEWGTRLKFEFEVTLWVPWLGERDGQ